MKPGASHTVTSETNDNAAKLADRVRNGDQRRHSRGLDGLCSCGSPGCPLEP